MKRWALVTVFLYAIVISILAAPLLWLFWDGSSSEAFEVFFLFLLPVLVAIQAILLLVPVAVARRRPVKKRTAATSATAGAFLMAVLLSCSVLFVLNMLLGEDTAGGDAFGWILLGLLASLWLFWGVFFFRSFTADDPESLTDNIMRWLLRGSILEILIAIPAHILARHRNECCAPGLTILGLITGIAVSVMAFGPGLFFLFAARVKEKRVAGAP
ncbi:MAG: hypothetical protein HKO65_11995 [Gemmatimonadetes bacterium]|nr:hypothetical protein [Gemmatimonadota bacterium]NNM05801.1 hypothetical protein [Gemmatimonadota bacterium]